MTSHTFIILTARNEADRIEATLRALTRAFPGAPVWVADDGSDDETPRIAEQAGARLVRGERPIGKGGAATLAARAALGRLAGDGTDLADPATAARTAGGTAGPVHGAPAVAVLCDGDLGESAVLLTALADAVREGRTDVAVAAFARRLGGGLGLALGFARWAIRRHCGLEMRAPISGQRAMRADALLRVLPFARGFGMEMGMTIDAARAGLRVTEIELDLSHRATGRTLGGFAHRARQLADFARAYLARR